MAFLIRGEAKPILTEPMSTAATAHHRPPRLRDLAVALPQADLDADTELKLIRKRAGAQILIVDDCLSVCEHLEKELRPRFPAGVSSETKPTRALDRVCRLASSKTNLLLVLDIEMPGMSGTELVLELARRGIVLPFVFHSGSQGNEEMRRFLSQLSGAQSARQLERMAEAHALRNAGLAYAYVPKEQRVFNPELLTKALDALLLSPPSKDGAIDLLRMAVGSPASTLPATPSTKLDRLFAALSDECLLYLTHHQRLSRSILDALPQLPLPRKARDTIRDLVQDLRVLFPFVDEYSFSSLRSLRTEKDYGHWWHEFMGSRGMQRAFMIIEELMKMARQFRVAPMESLLLEHIGISKDFRSRTRAIDVVLTNALQPEVCVASLVRAIAAKRGLRVSTRGSLKVQVPQLTLYRTLEEALVNAHRYQKGSAEIVVSLAERPAADLGEKLHRHFTSHGYRSVGSIAIIDHGQGIPLPVLRAWREGGAIPSGRREGTGNGLGLMRESASELGNGIMTIDSSKRGTTVTFLIGREA